ncbi:acyltransferase [Roseobacter sp. YSTF-M11]|uniref:Acyltransferase n=1 Tax=Roseobacter insulae TaxID=2859783 RepID=A0A9X1K5E7_9RHOB|nr:acyltransferase [Roseobacter insulae]MBW4710772.1 acyltransferase [Roseobacter insulae]
MSLAHQRYLGVRFFGSLNGLRFLCIAAVMWHHSPARDVTENSFRLLARGFLGVDFFFVLSGFLITTLLLREEARHGQFSLKAFYWRRILRIVPVYFLVVTVVSAYFIGVDGRWDKLGTLPYYYLFFSNMLISDMPLLTITWSLAVEEQYYLMWPALLFLLPVAGRARPVVLVGLITFCILSAAGWLSWMGLRPIETELARWHLPATGYAAILIGSLAAVTLNHPKGFAVLYRLLGARMAPVVAFPALLVVLYVTPGVLTGWPNLLVHGTMAICLITIVIREDHALSGVFSWRPIARIGEISYGLYLYHLIGRHVGVEFTAQLGLDAGAEIWVSTLVFALVAVLIAEVSFQTFERYFLSFKHTKPFSFRRQARSPAK